jgi:Flp pilus assembly protein TadD
MFARKMANQRQEGRCQRVETAGMLRSMIRYVVVAWVLCIAALCSARGQAPDEKYVGIYHLIQEADNLNDGGNVREAVSRYLQAQTALKDFESAHPDWNPKIVKFRLEYVGARLEPLARKLPDTNAPAVTVAATNAPGASLTNQLQQLQKEIERLGGQNALLEAKLKEALSVQPAPMDPRELAKAEERIKQLTKERDLLKVVMEQQQGTAMKLTDPGALEAERKLLAEIKEKLAEQTRQNEALRKENDDLKRQVAEMKPLLEMPVGEKNELGAQLQIAKATILALQSSNVALRTHQIELEKQMAELSKQGGGAMPQELQRQLQLAQARLEVYEARRLPYTAEELGLMKQPDTRVSATPTNAPARKTRELPPGAAPLMAEAQRAIDSGRFEEAETKLRDILRQDEKNGYVLSTLAAVQMELHRAPEAEATLKQALAADANDPASLFLMGYLKFQQGQQDAALEALSLAAKILPDDARTQYFLGKTLLQKGMRAQGETALRRAVNLKPGWAEAHFSLAMVYATQQPPFKELAQWHYQKALASGYPRNQEFERLMEEKRTTARVP